MAIADIITGGFGSFSSINFIPTRGFTPGTAVTVTYTGAALDYYCVASSPYYATSITAPQFLCLNTRPFYAVVATDRFIRHIVQQVTLAGLVQENGYALLLESGDAILQE